MMRIRAIFAILASAGAIKLQPTTSPGSEGFQRLRETDVEAAAPAGDRAVASGVEYAEPYPADGAAPAAAVRVSAPIAPVTPVHYEITAAGLPADGSGATPEGGVIEQRVGAGSSSESHDGPPSPASSHGVPPYPVGSAGGGLEIDGPVYEKTVEVVVDRSCGEKVSEGCSTAVTTCTQPISDACTRLQTACCNSISRCCTRFERWLDTGGGECLSQCCCWSIFFAFFIGIVYWISTADPAEPRQDGYNGGHTPGNNMAVVAVVASHHAASTSHHTSSHHSHHGRRLEQEAISFLCSLLGKLMQDNQMVVCQENFDAIMENFQQVVRHHFLPVVDSDIGSSPSALILEDK